MVDRLGFLCSILNDDLRVRPEEVELKELWLGFRMSDLAVEVEAVVADASECVRDREDGGGYETGEWERGGLVAAGLTIVAFLARVGTEVGLDRIGRCGLLNERERLGGLGSYVEGSLGMW